MVKRIFKIVILVYPDIISSAMDGTSWLGFYDVMNTSIYTWLDGNMITTSFFQNEPTNPTLPCANDNLKGTWHESDCNVKRNVACKRPSGINVLMKLGLLFQFKLKNAFYSINLFFTSFPFNILCYHYFAYMHVLHLKLCRF